MYQVPRTSYLGESLTNVVIEVIDERGSVDTALDGGLHNLLANFNKHSVYSLRSGRCSLPPVALPSVVGLWRAEIKHAAYPSLKLEIEVWESHDVIVCRCLHLYVRIVVRAHWYGG